MVKAPFLRKKGSLESKNLDSKRSSFNYKGQMKIQQMAIMIVAVFFFFVLVGLFFLGILFKDVGGEAERLHREQAISSLRVIADMPELNYDSSWSMSVDEDKLRIMSGEFGRNYDLFWPVASVGVYRAYPRFDEVVECPGVGCNYYGIYDNGQGDTLTDIGNNQVGASYVKTYSTYVAICEKVRESGSTYDDCEVGKLVGGVKGGGDE